MTEPTRWVTAAVLQALARQQVDLGASFLGTQLDGWLDGAISHTQRVHATTRLCALGFLQHRVRGVGGDRVGEYKLTAAGWEAVREAAAGQVRRSGPKGPHGRRHALDAQSLSARLWALLRMRRVLDAESAANTLCDAGDDYERMRASIRRYLRRWADAGALQESARRVGAQGTSNGFKRFVLVADAPQPPSLYGRGGAA